jgi:hypothetical protein
MPKKGSSGQRVKPLSLYFPPDDPVFAALLADLAAAPYDRQSKLRQWVKQGYLAQQAGESVVRGAARDFSRIPGSDSHASQTLASITDAVSAAAPVTSSTASSFPASAATTPVRIERERPAPFGSGHAVPRPSTAAATAVASSAPDAARAAGESAEQVTDRRRFGGLL